MMKPEAVLALNAGLDESGSINLDTQARVLRAARYVIAHDVPNLVFVGGNSFEMAEFANDQPFIEDLPPIQLEARSHDTIGNAHFSKLKYLRPNQWENIIVCTADYHINRSDYIFRRVLDNPSQHLMLSADTQYSAAERKRLERKEKVLRIAAQALLWGINSSGDDRREKRLVRLHPRYRG